MTSGTGRQPAAQRADEIDNALIAAAAAGQFYRLRKAAGLLMVPYLAWLIFAAMLNSSIGTLNPGAGTSLLGL